MTARRKPTRGGARKGAGRPASTVPLRTGRIAFRVTESQERAAFEAAERAGVRLSDFARDALLRAVDFNERKTNSAKSRTVKT